MKKRVYSLGPASKSEAKNKIAVVRHLAALTSILACGAVLAWAQPAAAQPQDGSYDALRSFARDVGIEQSQPTPIAASSQDEAYSALLDFASMVGADAPVKAAAKPAPAKSPKRENKGGEGDAYFVGSNKCMTCHAAVSAEFSNTLMGRVGKTTRKGTMECENCHGAGSQHVAAGGGRGVGGVNGFRSTDPKQIEENNGVCLTCHEKGERTAWKGSTHDTRGLACSNCHTVMRKVSPKFQLSSPTEAEVCFQCHKDRRAQLYRSSHMPIREGKMTCYDCHNPHGSPEGTEAMLRGTSINDNCYKCHAEKRGPFLWEHAPVAENCLNCHDAHGSINEAMLKISRPRLCGECHGFGHSGQVQNQFNRMSFNKSCGNCHVKIHGSNHPSGNFLER